MKDINFLVVFVEFLLISFHGRYLFFFNDCLMEFRLVNRKLNKKGLILSLI